MPKCHCSTDWLFTYIYLPLTVHPGTKIAEKHFTVCVALSSCLFTYRGNHCKHIEFIIGNVSLKLCAVFCCSQLNYTPPPDLFLPLYAKAVFLLLLKQQQWLEIELQTASGCCLIVQNPTSQWLLWCDARGRSEKIKCLQHSPSTLK